MALPGLHGTEHIGFTVPNLRQAIDFFVDIIGCEAIYSLGPFASEGNWMEEHLGVPRQTVMKQLTFLRCGNGPNFEIFEYDAPQQRTDQPLNSDVGGHHLAFYVSDFDAGLAYLRSKDVEIMGEPTVRTEGPSAGQTWIYFRTPWKMQLELVSFPCGKGYERSTDRRLWQPNAVEV